VCLCCGYSLKETADFTFSAHDMFLEFYFFPTINVLFMYTVSDCHEKAIIKSMQFTSQIERLLYNIIGFEPTKWTIYYTFTFINSDLILEKSLKITRKKMIYKTFHRKLKIELHEHH